MIRVRYLADDDQPARCEFKACPRAGEKIELPSRGIQTVREVWQHPWAGSRHDVTVLVMTDPIHPDALKS